jgi:hypothetical protein
MTCINTERIIDAGNESSESFIRVPSLCKRTGERLRGSTDCNQRYSNTEILKSSITCKMFAGSSLRLFLYKSPCRRRSLTFFPQDV